MLTVEKIKKILVHDILPIDLLGNSWLPVYEVLNGREQLFLSYVSDDDLVEKFKTECIYSSQIFINLKTFEQSQKQICESLSDAKKYFHFIDLEYFQTVEFDNRKFAFAEPEFVGILAEDKDGMRDLKILNSNAVIELVKKNEIN